MLPHPYLMVGLTGSIGSGKSAVANIFASLGVKIIDADLLAREAVMPGTPALQEILSQFGAAMILPDGSLDRKKLGEKVFSNPAARTTLESIVHPRIRDLFLYYLSQFEKDPNHSTLCMYVVPLLFESGNRYHEIKKTVVVSAPREICIARIMGRDGCTRDLAERKIDSQMSIEEKEKRADFVIHNGGSFETLEASVRTVYDQLTALI